MNIFEQKINYAVSIVVAFFSAILGKFWFLFVFLLGLNMIDYITGLLKARYLHTESSKKAMKGFVKKFLIWCLVAVGFGLGIVFEQIGEVIGINLSIMQCIGWFILTHCIINEIRSILENMVEMDKDNLIPNWLIKGLEVAKNKLDTKAEQILTHCIINEIRSILENMVEMDKDNLIPNWLIKGLEVAKNKLDTKAEQIIETFENNGGNKNENK